MESSWKFYLAIITVYTLKFWVVLSLDPCSRRRLRGAISCDNERGITVVVQKISSNKCICLFTLFFHQFFFFVQSLVDSAMIESEMGDDTATRDGIITIV
jgi:hypothetical protein